MRKVSVTLLTVLLLGGLLQAEESKGITWPATLVKGKARLVRLKYKGGNWDKDMGEGGDYNLLLKYSEYTGLKIAPRTENVTAKELRQLPDEQLPAFLFITGSRGLRLTENEVESLRWYCQQKRGLLFIDNGGGRFHHAVQALVSRLFPERELVFIPNDDPLYQQPYRFPKGAPPLWHHSGDRALGVEFNNRWAVFYHQGDIHDIWKDGHSHPPEWFKDPEKGKEIASLAEKGYKMGINVLCYAYSQFAATPNDKAEQE